MYQISRIRKGSKTYMYSRERLTADEICREFESRNESSQWKHSWLINNSKSLLEDQVSNLSLSVSLTQSSEETVAEVLEPDDNLEENPDAQEDEQKSSDEEDLDEALMSILENFSDEEKDPP